jgi:hypothetical protein
METPMTRIAAGLLVVLALAACSDSTEPADSVAGSYTATRAIVTDAGTPTDALAVGVTIHITLAENGTTTGTVHIPGILSDSGDPEDQSLTGTWTANEAGTQVTFDFDDVSDFAFEGTPWTVDGNTLNFSSSTGEGDSIEITLTKD